MDACQCWYNRRLRALVICIVCSDRSCIHAVGDMIKLPQVHSFLAELSNTDFLFFNQVPNITSVTLTKGYSNKSIPMRIKM